MKTKEVYAGGRILSPEKQLRIVYYCLDNRLLFSMRRNERLTSKNGHILVYLAFAI